MKSVIAYVRVSTDGQVGEDKFGIDAQVDQIQDYCKAHDLNVVEWVSDEGISGAKDERPGLNRIVYGDLPEDVTNIIVAKNDRLARKVDLFFAYKYKLRQRGIEVISVNEDFGDLGFMKPAFEALVAAIAEVERQNITKRTSGGRKIKASRGGYSGGRPPMGYKVSDGKLIINEDEAPTVRFIFSHKRAGDTMIGTMRALNEAGYHTRAGKAFQISTVQSIWNNEKTYLGWYHYGDTDEWVKGQHDPIIEEVDPR